MMVQFLVAANAAHLQCGGDTVVDEVLDPLKNTAGDDNSVNDLVEGVINGVGLATQLPTRVSNLMLLAIAYACMQQTTRCVTVPTPF